MTKLNGDIRAAVIGSGRMATRVVEVLSALGRSVRLQSRNKEAASAIKKGKKNVELFDTISEACAPVDFIFLAVPAAAIGQVAQEIGEVLRGEQVIMHASRGVATDGEALLLPHQAIRKVSAAKKIGVLGGPLYFEELKEGRALSAVVGARYSDVCAQLKALVQNGPVRLHPTTDIIGVEVAGAISNVSALAVGMAEHLGLGETARGVILTHGLEDAAVLGRDLGADARTFSGLAGVGDLIPRRVSSTERHYAVGRALAEGKSEQEANDVVTGCVEGLRTARAVKAYAEKRELKLPLTSAVFDVMEGRVAAAEALEGVLRAPFVLGA